MKSMKQQWKCAGNTGDWMESIKEQGGLHRTDQGSKDAWMELSKEARMLDWDCPRKNKDA